MFGRIIRWLMGIVGVALGLKAADLVIPLLSHVGHFAFSDLAKLITVVATGIIFGFIFYFIAPFAWRRLRVTIGWIEVQLQNFSSAEIFVSTFGLIIGLLIAALLTLPFASLPYIGPFLPVFAALLFGYLGARVGRMRRDDLQYLFDGIQKVKTASPKSITKSANKQTPKILDTSVIIDGRIADICEAGFIEGTMIVPRFVLEELQKIADSSDMLKRNRGRRGLDVMNHIQRDLSFPVKIVDQDFNDITEVDSKLVRLAKQMGGKVLTNDYNLNKVAELQGVDVLNINELANAVKPVVIPGEEMSVSIVKDGKEAGQGIAYLDDGTMIVVEGGKRHMGEQMDVLVTSVLQTAAGRMIFAKINTDRFTHNG